MAVSEAEALAAEKAAKKPDDADRGDDFLPTEGDDDAGGKPGDADDKGPGNAQSKDEGEPEAKKDPEDAGSEKSAAKDDKKEGTDEPTPDKSGPVRGIPKHRFDSSQAARRRAEDEVRRLSGELAKKEAASPGTATNVPGDQAELDTKQEALDEKIAKATLDGDNLEVKRLTKESRHMERDFLRAEARDTSARQSGVVVARLKLDQTIEMLEGEYPAMDPDSKQYDAELVNEILDLQEDLVRGGRYTPADAMLRAVGYVMKGASHEEQPDAGNEVKDPPPPEKRKTNVEKNIDTDNRQPPDMDGVGSDSNKSGLTGTPDVNKITEDEFKALPDSTLKRMRGDFV